MWFFSVYSITGQELSCLDHGMSSFACSKIQIAADKKNLKNDYSGWWPAIAFLRLFLFHSLLRLTFFLSQNKKALKERERMKELELELVEEALQLQ